MSEVPKGPGEWWARRSKHDGRIEFVSTRYYGWTGLVADNDAVRIYKDRFTEFDWHRIELPEGWE